MAYTVSTVEPTSLTAGDSWQWDRAYSDYPSSDGWELGYVLTGAHESVIDLADYITDDSGTWEVRVPPATTAGYTAGLYRLVGYVSDGTDRHRVYSGPLTVLPDPAMAAPEPSHAEKSLAAVRARIEERLTADTSGFSIAQRQVQREELRELRKQEAIYAERVRRERGGPIFQPVKVTFGAPS